MWKERTLVIIKPDGIQRSLIGEVIQRYERIGLKMSACKMIVPTEEMVETHYTIDPEWKRKVGEKAIAGYEKEGKIAPDKDPVSAGNRVLGVLKKYMTCGPVLAMVWQGAHAVEIVKKITGSTEPRSSDIGTIRGDYVLDSYQLSDSDGRAVRNILHCSSSVSDAGQEINLWFKPDELINYNIVQEQILYDINLDGILE